MGPIMCFEFSGPSVADGALAMPSVTCPQPRAVFDGQHRARAAMRLLRSDAFDIDDGDDDAALILDVAAGGSPPHGRASTRIAETRDASSPMDRAMAGRTRAFPAAEVPVGGQHSDFDLIIEGGQRPRIARLLLRAAAAPRRSAAAPPCHCCHTACSHRKALDACYTVYPVASEAEVKRLFLEVNKGESVMEIDLPDQARSTLAHAHACTLTTRTPYSFGTRRQAPHPTLTPAAACVAYV